MTRILGGSRIWLGLAALLFGSGGMARGHLDELKFGDPAAQKAHGFVGDDTRAGIGGLDEPCRQIEPAGALVFDLKCDPKKQNYLTLKLWGSDTQVCALFLASATRRYGRYGEAVPELDLNQGGATFPGRFYYATYSVPREMTTGKTRVRLKLLAVGAISPYAPRDKVEGPLRGPSRGIYRAYLDTEPFFRPGPDEKQGTPPTRAVRARTLPLSALAEANRKYLDEAVARLLRGQLYGPEWDARVARSGAPAAAGGATVRAGVPRSVGNWLDWATQRATDGNCQNVGIIGVYARAYHLAGSTHYHQPELLERVARALDYACVAQGRNGGFTAQKWVGGPDRVDAGGFIEGDGTRWLGRALLEVRQELTHKGLLDQGIDDDNDPKTPPVPRRTAYARMFARHRDFLVSPAGRGRATNQDQFQMLAMWLANEALRHLAPEQAWPREKALDYVYQAVGLTHDPLGGFWVTHKGLPLEPWGTLGGGYCGNYGLKCVHLMCELAEVTGDAKVQQQARAAVRAGSHFYYPDTDDHGLACYRKEGVISTRNTKWPCVIDYGLDAYAAADLKSPEALRAFQLWLADGNEPKALDERGPFVAEATQRIFAAGHFEKVLTMPAATVRLFAEPGQGDGAWADEQGGVAAVRHGSARLMVSLNWRRGFNQKRDPQHTRVNNIARIHYTTPAVDRTATIAMESPHGFGKLYLCRYGDYLIAMNLTRDTPYALPPVVGAERAVDLISGRSVDAARPVPLPPSSSVVLYLGRMSTMSKMP